MTTRVLPIPEWPRLAGTELAEVWPVLGLGSQILVVEDGDRIVGCWALIPYRHVEGLWIHPDYRKRGSHVGAHLLGEMRALLRAHGIGTVITGAATDDVRRLVQHLGGVRLPGEAYRLLMVES